MEKKREIVHIARNCAERKGLEGRRKIENF